VVETRLIVDVDAQLAALDAVLVLNGLATLRLDVPQQVQVLFAKISQRFDGTVETNGQ
jgi:hypothetical protein